MAGTRSEEVRAEARLDKKTAGHRMGQLVCCGNKQAGTDQYWCSGVLGKDPGV
jgi:hypothetical protein